VFKQMLAAGPGDTAAAPPDMVGPMMDMMIQAQQFNDLFKKELAGVGLVISLIGLPLDAEALSLWQMADPPKLAAIVTTQLPPVQEAVRRGYIAALVVHRPDAAAAAKSAPDSVEAFDRRFLLVTPDNVAEVSARYEMLFPEF
jgi:hypothetical protein